MSFKNILKILLTEDNFSTVACMLIQSKLNERLNKKLERTRWLLNKYQSSKTVVSINTDRRMSMDLTHLVK